MALLSHGHHAEHRRKRPAIRSVGGHVEQMLSVYLPWMLVGMERNPKTQGQGSNGYLSPKSIPAGGEVALDYADSFFQAAASQSVWPVEPAEKPAGQSTHAYSSL
jgi:hypothetical protein